MKRIYLSPPHMSGKELKYIKEAFKDNWIAPIGPHLTKFEKSVSQYVGSKYAVAVSSGTAAIHLGLLSLGVKEDDYVITSTLTFAGTVNPIKYIGAKPIFIDSDLVNWNMDPILLETAILKSPKKPKVIIPVHIFGIPCDMTSIMKIANQYNIPVLEDAAESLGSKHKNKHTGTFGEIGVYSFNGNKLLSTSGGGILVTDNKDIADKVKFLSTQAKEPEDFYYHKEVGYNYRMSNVLAAIGLGQIEVIEKRVKKARQINEIYKDNLKEYSDFIGGFQIELKGDRSNRWLTTAWLNSKFNPQELINYLEKYNIESRRIWYPMHQQPIFSNHSKYINGIADGIFKQGICLPSGTGMTTNDLMRVIDKIKDFYNDNF